jgi:hypothetical protein
LDIIKYAGVYFFPWAKGKNGDLNLNFARYGICDSTIATTLESLALSADYRYYHPLTRPL